MKTFLQRCCYIISLLTPISSFAYVDFLPHDPFIGVGIGKQMQDWQADYGKNHFKDGHLYGNFTIGALLTEYFGLQVGMQTMQHNQEWAYYPSGTAALGFVTAAPDEYTFISETSLNGYFVDLFAQYPLVICEKTHLIGVIGFANEKMYLKSLVIKDINPATNPMRWETKRKAIFRGGIGIKHMLAEKIGAKILYIWENTSRLHSQIAPPVPIGGDTSPSVAADYLTVRPKNSGIVFLELFYQGKGA